MRRIFSPLTPLTCPDRSREMQGGNPEAPPSLHLSSKILGPLHYRRLGQPQTLQLSQYLLLVPHEHQNSMV